MQLKLYYFAQLREALGINQEQIDCPPDVINVGQLRAWMGARSGPYVDAFAQTQNIRCAVNRVVADDNQYLSAGCEIAFFPPVTGG